MHSPTIVGVDPGLVHTGVVMLDFDTDEPRLSVAHARIDGLDADATRTAIEVMTKVRSYATLDIFIEEYRPRSGFSTDMAMMQANSDFKKATEGQLLRNTGVTKVVSKELLELCHVWKFGTTTHHQDLRSAARIGLLGMMLDQTLNKVLFDYVVDNVDGRNWDVQHR